MAIVNNIALRGCWFLAVPNSCCSW